MCFGQTVLAVLYILQEYATPEEALEAVMNDSSDDDVGATQQQITMLSVNIFSDNSFTLNWILSCDHSLELSLRFQQMVSTLESGQK